MCPLVRLFGRAEEGADEFRQENEHKHEDSGGGVKSDVCDYHNRIEVNPDRPEHRRKGEIGAVVFLLRPIRGTVAVEQNHLNTRAVVDTASQFFPLENAPREEKERPETSDLFRVNRDFLRRLVDGDGLFAHRNPDKNSAKHISNNHECCRSHFFFSL